MLTSELKDTKHCFYFQRKKTYQNDTTVTKANEAAKRNFLVRHRMCMRKFNNRGDKLTLVE